MVSKLFMCMAVANLSMMLIYLSAVSMVVPYYILQVTDLQNTDVLLSSIVVCLIHALKVLEILQNTIAVLLVKEETSCSLQ